MTLKKKHFPYDHWELLGADRGDRLRIVPERGGLITEWRCKGKEILYFDLERFKQKDKSIRGGIPVLFPICGNLPGDLLQLEKGNFKLRQHGFARDIAWKIKSMNDPSCFLLSFLDNKETRAAFPYSFLVEMEVRLERNAINFKIIIRNFSTEKMPFSFGLHPYFNVMDLVQTTIEGLPPTCTNQLKMIEAKTAEQISAISEGIDFISGPSNLVTLVDQCAGTRLHLQHQAPMDLTVVWSDPPRKMVCLEPWTSPRFSLINGERKLSLDPGAFQELKCRFIID